MYLGDTLVWPTRTGFCVETVQLPIRSNCAQIPVIGENLTIENHLGLDWYIIDSRNYGRIVAKDPSFDVINQLCVNRELYYYIEFDFILLDLADTTFPLFVFNFGSSEIKEGDLIGYGAPMIWRLMNDHITETQVHPMLVGYNSDSVGDWGTINLKNNELMSFRLIASITGPDISVIFQHVQTNNQIWGNLTCNASMHGEYIAFGGHGYDPSVDESYYGRFKFGIRNIRVGQEFMPTT